MKVTTLACIQGAWLPKFQPNRILDIGAGTGLLSLMAAQQFNCVIDAIEIDADAYHQLQENVNQSPWSDRIFCHHNDIKNFTKPNSIRYDLIISNPPFYSNQLKSKNHRLNQAKHQENLSITTLISVVAKLINRSGKISVLLPPAPTSRFMGLGEQYSLFPNEQLVISDNEINKPIAVISLLSNAPAIPSVKHIAIKKGDGCYSEDFISLMKDYYLYL